MNTTRKELVTSNKEKSNIFDFGLNNKYFSLTFLKLIKIFKTFSENIFLKEIFKYLDSYQWFSDCRWRTKDSCPQRNYMAGRCW